MHPSMAPKQDQPLKCKLEHDCNGTMLGALRPLLNGWKQGTCAGRYRLMDEWLKADQGNDHKPASQNAWPSQQRSHFFPFPSDLSMAEARRFAIASTLTYKSRTRRSAISRSSSSSLDCLWFWDWIERSSCQFICGREANQIQKAY